MDNVKKSKINIEMVKDFFVSGYKQLLVSKTTQDDLIAHELPLINSGVLTEERPVLEPIDIEPTAPLINANPTNLFVAGESLKSGFDVTGPTPITPEVKPLENDIPLVNPEVVSSEMPVVTPIEVKPITPLVSDNTNNTFIKTGSELRDYGSDVIGPTPIPLEEKPIIEPIPTSDDISIENSISEVSEMPKREVISNDDIQLETPQAFNERIEQTVNPVIESIPEDPYVAANVEVEKIRNEFNDKIDKILSEAQMLKETTNLNLDNVSRTIEKARQMSQNDAEAIMSTVQNEINSLNQTPNSTLSR